MKITILTDKTSWFQNYLENLKKNIQQIGHKVEIISNPNDLEKGDIAFFLSCFDIIDKEKLELNKNNLVVHESNLPKGKGWSPATWQILEGKNEIPIVLFEAVEKVDAGNIYLQDKIKLNGTELINGWQNKIAEKTIALCLQFVKEYPEILKKAIIQKGKESFYKKRTPKDSQLDINKNIKDQFNLFRVVDNEKYPAFFEYKGKTYILKIEKKNED